MIKETYKKALSKKISHNQMTTKLLIIRFSSIGDIVLTTPIVRCLKKQMGDEVEIHYLTKDKFFSVLQHNPHIDRIITLEDKLGKIMPELKRQKYDHIIDLHNSMRSALIKFSLKKPAKSFYKLNVQKWLMVNFKINHLPDVHIVDRYMNTVNFLDVNYDGNGLDYFLAASDELNKNDLPDNFQNGYITFVIGGKHNTKKMPGEKIISICNKINYPVVILGGKEDEAEGNTVASSCGQKVYNGCGKYSLNKSASIVKHSKAVITHDTGLMHIAAAFRKPTVSVWGNTVPEFGMYPFFPFNAPDDISKITEVKNLSCRPCSKIGYKKCPKKHFKCMKEINEDEIIGFIKKFI